MVDLDGARSGVRVNFPMIYQVIQNSGLKVELGGGIKTELDVITVGECRGGPAGHRLCGGLQTPDLVSYALELYGGPGGRGHRQPETARYAPPAGRRTPAWTIWNSPPKWSQSV